MNCLTVEWVWQGKSSHGPGSNPDNTIYDRGTFQQSSFSHNGTDILSFCLCRSRVGVIHTK